MAAAAFEEIVENFAMFDDWEDRYRYLIDLGKQMPELPPAQRVPEYKVDGCASQVWLVPRIEGEGAQARLNFAGDSDAMIVRGLIAVLAALFGGQPMRDVAQADAPSELARLGLAQALSAQRSNGLRAMVQRLQDLARASSPA